MGKNKRKTKPAGNRAERLAQRRAERERDAIRARPFRGLASECDLVALREFISSATAELAVAGTRPVVLATVLPGAVAALVREDERNSGFVAAQTQRHADDPAAALAAAVAWTQLAEPGSSLQAAVADGDTPDFAEVVDVDTELTVTVHSDFAWWLPAGVSTDPEITAAIDRANAAIQTSARLELADDPGAAWWTDTGERAYLRFVRPEDEDAVMLAMARLHAAGELTLGDGSRFAGSLRTHGLLVPVFDLDPERGHDEWAGAGADFVKRLADAIDDAPLTPQQRRSRDGLRARQLTL